VLVVVSTSEKVMWSPSRTKIARRVGVAVAVLSSALAVAACGSSGTSKDASASNGSDTGLKLAACMRSHGVPNLPDSATAGGGVTIQAGSGIDPASPAFQQAEKACRKLLPGGGPGGGRASAKVKEQMLQISECMRAHGVSGFPDPTSSPPSSLTDYSAAFGQKGSFIAIPKTIDVNSPVFKQAAATCHLPGS
jgi:hypothetical protein